jgi:hypothetical protein
MTRALGTPHLGHTTPDVGRLAMISSFSDFDSRWGRKGPTWLGARSRTDRFRHDRRYGIGPRIVRFDETGRLGAGEGIAGGGGAGRARQY